MKNIINFTLIVFLVIFFSCSKKDDDNNNSNQNTSPTASFTVSPSSGTTETQFQFNASGCSDKEDETSVLQVRWDWENDGNWDTDWLSNKTVNHQYNIAGNYTVALEVKDSGGLTDSETHNVTVQEGGSNTPPTAVFAINPTSGTTSTTFQFDASGSYDAEDPTSALQVRWDWENDGNWDTYWSTDKTENHQYGSEGTYTVKMEVKDTEGLTDYVTHNVTVSNGGGEPCPGIPTVTYGGQVYNTVLIGNQCWLKENLNIGTRINGSEEMSNNGTIEKYCYNDDLDNCDEYGGLYQWDEMMQYTTQQGTQGICPNGWHLPTDDEWCTLTTYIDPTVNCNTAGWSGIDAGYKMKSTSGWCSNGNGSDAYGFEALPGGRRYYSGEFNYLANDANFWSSSEGNSNGAWHLRLYYNYDEVYRNNYNKGYGFSVRCVQD